MSRSGCACIKPKLATASAKSKIPGIMTRRVPKRSISQPITGHDTATNQALAPNPPDRSPRLMPRSSVIGLRNTPKVKIRMAPAPTNRPQAEANTIHQRLAKIPVMMAFPLAPRSLCDISDDLFCQNVSGPAGLPQVTPGRRANAIIAQTWFKGSG
jgi:hypothetical protein